MYDNVFYKISLVSFLVLFGSMVFFLIEYREKKGNSTFMILETEQAKSLNVKKINLISWKLL